MNISDFVQKEERSILCTTESDLCTKERERCNYLYKRGLNNLRYFSNLYFHGHSVGGTNPSLLEAMASQALVIAHNNDFNKGVLKENAYYFSNPIEVKKS